MRTICGPLASSIVLLVIAATIACKSAPQQRRPAEVGTVTIQPEKVILTTELPGRTSPYLVADIRPQVNGIIQKRLFEEGADVKAGSLLYQIEPALYEAAFDQAKAAYEMAQAGLPAARARVERLRNLVNIRAVGKQDYDDAAAALQTAEASAAAAKATMESARINLEYTPIKAPISGRIGRSSVTVGALVTAYQPVPLAVIQQLDPIYVDVTQSSADLLRLRRALQSGTLKQGGENQSNVKLFLEDGSPYPLAGTLQFREVTVEPTTGSVTLRMVFPNPEHILLPGMFVRAVVEEGVAEQAVLAPQQGVSRDVRGNPYAWVVSTDEKAELRPLEIDRAIGSRWLVAKGLAAGDRVIVDGLQRVAPGSPVKAVPCTPSADQGARSPEPKPATDSK